MIHLVDFDGAQRGSPANLEAVGAIASRVAVPIQLAGGLEGADQIRLAFAAGATRVVLAMASPTTRRSSPTASRVAGDWLAVGLDPRPERLAAFPWRRPSPPASLEALVDELADRGVRRFVLVARRRRAGRGAPGPPRPLDRRRLLVAGGVTDLDGIRRLRDRGVAGIILGEALLSGAIDFAAALEAAA